MDFLQGIISALEIIWRFVTSGYGTIVYIIVIFLIIFWLIVAMMKDDRKQSELLIHINGIKERKKENHPVSVIGGGNGEGRENSRPRESRFFQLTKIDETGGKEENETYDEKVTLEELCEEFRNFSAEKLKLFYSKEDVRHFIAGMGVSHIVIMQGMSGTGKTSLAYAFGEYLKNPSVIVPIQPMWKERTDLIGYYNEFTKKFNETALLEKMYEANYSEDIYITVLDEMNIARVEYYFAEFLSLLELPREESRWLDIISDKWTDDPKQFNAQGQMKLPSNMWFIGTANNDDSTFAISDKVYDRAMVMNLDKKAEVFEGKQTPGKKVSAEHFKELVEESKREYAMSGRSERRIKKMDEYLIEKFHITFGNRIMKQMRDYVSLSVACGGSEEDALDDIIAKKVVRKLETQNPVYVRKEAENLNNYFDEVFGTDKMPLCKSAVSRIERNA